MSVEHEDTFEAFLDGDDGSLLRTARLLTGDQHDAEDLLQETLLQVHRRWRRVAAADEPGAYVRRILINTFLSKRRKRRLRTTPLSEARDMVDQGPGIANRVVERDSLAAALPQLGERERTAVVLRHYLQFTAEEIGTEMGITTSSARSTLSRGIASLRRVLTTGDTNSSVRSE